MVTNTRDMGGGGIYFFRDRGVPVIGNEHRFYGGGGANVVVTGTICTSKAPKVLKRSENPHRLHLCYNKW